MLLGPKNGRSNYLLFLGPAALEFRPTESPFVVDTPGGSGKTGELGPVNPLNGGMQVPGGFIIDVGEEVWRFDRVVSGVGLNEAACSGYWKSFGETMSGESKMTTAYNRG